MLLAQNHEIAHLALDIVADPYCRFRNARKDTHSNMTSSAKGHVQKTNKRKSTLTCKAPHQDNMGRKPILLPRPHVAKRKSIQPFLAGICIHTRNGQQHGPRNEPDREEDFDHHTQKADEEVGVHAILESDVVVVCSEYFIGPCEESGGERRRAFSE